MFITYRKGRIHFSDKGSGDVVVLLHGYLESGEVWNGFAEKLSSKYRVIIIDLPGHGLSDVYGEVHTMEFMATALKELLSMLEIKKIFLAGHSLGGYVSLAFLELFPEYLSGYCLFHSHPFADTAEAIAKRGREIEVVMSGKKNLIYPDNVTNMFAESNLDAFSEALQRSKEIASGIPGDGIIAVLNGMIRRPSRLSFMEEGKVPCLWILGAMDKYIPRDAVQPKVKIPSNCKVVILEKSGHIGFVEEEVKSVEILSEFIYSLEKR
jgi:pimeloyl-ACP methyl ester carboxylesterase